MAATYANQIAPENLRAMLLAYGINHAYRVVTLEEINHSMPHVGGDQVKVVLEGLANEGLVTRFSGRYCFNRVIPANLRQSIDELVTPSGTIRKRAN